MLCRFAYVKPIMLHTYDCMVENNIYYISCLSRTKSHSQTWQLSLTVAFWRHWSREPITTLSGPSIFIFRVIRTDYHAGRIFILCVGSSTLNPLHWLPFRARMASDSPSTLGPLQHTCLQWFQWLCHVMPPSGQLLRTNLKFDDRAFSASNPKGWNNIPA